MLMLQSFVLLLLLLLARTRGVVYQYTGDPYVIGHLNVAHTTLGKHFDSNPEHVTAYYPVANGSYAPVLFVPGLYGVIYAEWYSDVLERVASHGFIMIGVDTFWPAVSDTPTPPGNITEEPQFIFKILQWLVDHLNQDVLAQYGVMADWSVLGLGGHSAGADTVLKMIQHNSTVAKAIAFMEPFSFFFKQPLGYTLPSLSYGTEYSEESPKCVYPGVDYLHFYNMLQCPKIIMNVTGFGHCDILNEINWETCRLLHFCKTNHTNNRQFYHTFVSGVMTAFYGTYLQHSTSLLQYITVQHLVPTAMGLFKNETSCD